MTEFLLLARALPESGWGGAIGFPGAARLPELLRCLAGVSAAEYASLSALLAQYGSHPAILAALEAYDEAHGGSDPILLVRFSRERLADLLAVLLQHGFAGFSPASPIT